MNASVINDAKSVCAIPFQHPTKFDEPSFDSEVFSNDNPFIVMHKDKLRSLITFCASWNMVLIFTSRKLY